MAGIVAGQDRLRSTKGAADPVEPVDSSGPAAGKVSDAPRAKAAAGENLKLFLVLSQQMDKDQVLRIRSTFHAAIRRLGTGDSLILKGAVELHAGAIATLDWDDGFRVYLLPLS